MANVIQFIKVVVIGGALLVAALAVLLPYWFSITCQVSYDGGRVMLEKTLDVGLYYMDKGELNMIDMVFQSEAANEKFVPNMVRVAQVFFFVGSSGLFVAFGAALISLFRKYRSVAGEICLAAAMIPTSICLLLGVVFAMLSVLIDNGNGWNNLPNPGGFVLIEPNADVTMNFGLYVGAISAVAAIVGCLICWMEACSACREVEAARYQMLRAPIVPEGSQPGRGKRGRNEVDF